MNELETIRRAYRYVVAYERRVIDSIALVDEALRGRAFERYGKSRSLHTEWPSRSKVLDKWAWDNVPNYARRFEWRRGEENTAGSCFVIVDHVADTSFENRVLDGRGGEPDPLEDLEPAAASRSILRWIAVSFAGPLPTKLYNEKWGILLAQHFGTGTSPLRISEPVPEPHRREAAPLTLVTHCIDLAELTNADALRARFIEPLLTSIGDP